jgi:hypothetical protein
MLRGLPEPEMTSNECRGASPRRTRYASPMDDELPEIIERYVDAVRIKDRSAMAATFHDAARIVMEGTVYDGIDAIRGWFASDEWLRSFSMDVLDVQPSAADRFRVLTHHDGNFPGESIDLLHEFALRDGLISEMVVGIPRP